MKSRLVAPCWNLSKKRAFHLAAFAADAERCLERYERLAEQALQYACRLRLISRNARRFLFCQSSSLLTREKLLSAFLRGRVTEGRPCTILELPPDPFRRRGSLWTSLWHQRHKTNTGAKTNIGALHPFRRALWPSWTAPDARRRPRALDGLLVRRPSVRAELSTRDGETGRSSP